jgi:dTDP-4-dehydrorhamnose 3,5-epimerase
MKVLETDLPGVLLIEPDVYPDERGRFREAWREGRYAEYGIGGPFTQDNLSVSRKGVLRGLHIQAPAGQGKLVFAVAGAIFDVAVDVRRHSPHYGQWVGETLTADNHRQLWVPEGFLHGFCVLSEEATVFYKCTRPYIAEQQHSVRWDDPDIGIRWPLEDPILSEKDRMAPVLRDSIFAGAIAE